MTAPLINRRAAGRVSRATATAQIAAAIDSSREKCQAGRPVSPARWDSVELPEFIVKSVLELRIGRERGGWGGVVRAAPARPAHRHARHEPDANHAAGV